jgi:hypothetical protein
MERSDYEFELANAENSKDRIATMEKYINELETDVGKLKYRVEALSACWRKYPDKKPNKGGLKFVIRNIDGKIWYGAAVWHQTHQCWHSNNDSPVLAWARIPKGTRLILGDIMEEN